MYYDAHLWKQHVALCASKHKSNLLHMYEGGVGGGVPIGTMNLTLSSDNADR